MSAGRFFGMVGLGALLIVGAPGCGDDASQCDGCRIDGVCVDTGALDPLDSCRVCSPDQSSTAWTLLDEAAGECVANCPGCGIDGQCYHAFERNPDNPCQVCNVDLDPRSWSDDDGAVCDDGVFCNGADTCLEGLCSEHGGDPCDDDGVACNGDESCDEEAGRCVSSHDVCNPAETCDVDQDLCCAKESDLACNGDDDVVWVDSCGAEGMLVEDCLEGCSDGSCTCAPGTTGPACDVCVVYVDGANGSDSSTGDSWAQAFASLQLGLDTGNVNDCEVWVAEGTYQPTGGSPNVVDSTFQLYVGSVVRGGFAGTELAPELRDITAHPTVLDGERGDPMDANDNICHLMTGANDALVDGLTFANNTAFVHCAQFRGGSLYLGWGGEPLGITRFTLKNSTFVNNAGQIDAAGLFAYDVDMEIVGCHFEGNEGTLLWLEGGSLRLMDTSFIGNNEFLQQELVYIDYPDEVPEVDSCLFRDNYTSHAIEVRSGFIHLSNSHFEGNSGIHDGIVNVHLTKGTGRIDNCSFLSNTSTSGAGGLSFSGTHTMLVNNSLFFGNVGRYAGAIYASTQTTLRSCTIVGNDATNGFDDVSGGVLRNTGTIIRSSILWGNTTSGQTLTQAQMQANSPGHSYSLPSIRYSVLECDSPSCVSASQFCDGVADCPFGSDERNCGSCPNGIWCDGGCLPLANVCDGTPDCSGGEDEVYCGTCAAGTFACYFSCSDGPGMHYTDPLFVNDDPGAGTVDLTLQTGSVCIDGGRATYLASDELDLDSDGDVTEPIPVDLHGNPRVSGSELDMGAYEMP
jgi:Low-density lipoprotein receptor domain class A